MGYSHDSRESARAIRRSLAGLGPGDRRAVPCHEYIIFICCVAGRRRVDDDRGRNPVELHPDDLVGGLRFIDDGPWSGRGQGGAARLVAGGKRLAFLDLQRYFANAQGADARFGD